MADATNGGTGRPVVLVTGASSGIGWNIVERFAREGWDAVVVARRKENLDKLVAQLKGTARVVPYVGDITDPDTPGNAVKLAMDSFGRLDCLVNNAGTFTGAMAADTDDALLDEVIEVSLRAPFRFCREALKVMKPGSSILTVGSTWGILGGLGGAAYCAAKAGLIGLTQGIACEYGEGGIRANLIAPGVIKTDMTKDFWDYDFFQRINQEMTPFNRDGTIEDVSNTVYFLASQEGSYINGQTIALDGGWTTTKYLRREPLAAQRVPAA